MNSKLAKLQLYKELTKKTVEELTDTEINIMYELAKDEEIKAVFDELLEKERAMSHD